MWKRKILLAALATASVGVLPFSATAEVGFFVDVAPPAPRYEVIPAPRAGSVWVPGFWDWRGNHHVWSKGHFERERRGYYWHPNRWEQRDNRWVLEKGRWDRERFVENRPYADRDHDGVPNRLDRSPDNPHRQ